MREKLRSFVLRKFMPGAKPEDLRDDESFLDSGIIDSTGVVELLSFLEEEFAIEIDDAEIVPENLDSIDNLCRFLKAKLTAVS